ncbi:hypothetical protein V6K52_01815 [Knoellia sp. S7-12]|uniref:hypothetical protein n=1 Tax=Knoellia sp. S7-12 TaxID=3126698 RepID=UPI0033665491
MDISDWTALGSFIVAGLALYRSWHVGRQADLLAPGVAQAQKDAAKALTRSADAEEASVTALRDVHDAVRRLGPKEGVEWFLRHHNKDLYVLLNAGTTVAYDVSLTAVDPEMVFRKPEVRAQLHPGEEIKFGALRHGGAESTLQITWRTDASDPNSEATTQRELPPK